MTNLIHIASISGAHGIRGQVKIRSLSGDPSSITNHTIFTDATGKREFKLTWHGGTPKFFIAAIESINDRNAAELLTNTALYIEQKHLPALPENQWLHKDLIGLKAILENGQEYGRVVAVHNFGAGDIIEIEKNDGAFEMLPFSNVFIKDVHRDQGHMIVQPADYLD